MLGRTLAALVVSAVLTTAASAQGTDLIFAVTEGVTYQATPKEIRDKFAPLADYLGRATGRRLKVVLVPAYNDLRAGAAKQEYDLAFVHPAHVSMAEIKAGRYKAIAWTTGYTEYTASLLMNPNQPLKSLEDLKGHTIVTPDPDSITAAMVRAMFRAEKVPLSTAKELTPAAAKVITTRYQDAVPFYLEYGFAQVGVTGANAVAKAWTDKGGKDSPQVAPGSHQAVHRLDEDAGRRATAPARGARQHPRFEGRPRRAGSRWLQGLCGAQPRRRKLHDHLARLVGCEARSSRRDTAAPVSLVCTAASAAPDRSATRPSGLGSLALAPG